MNLKVIYTMLSRIMLVSGAMVALPLAISLIMGGPILAFIFSMAVAGLASVVLKKRGVAQENSLTPREGTAITALSWLFVSLLFALPYIFSGTLGPLDSLVESISGLTGTGATVIDDLGAVPQSILFFRAMTHWLGGLGIIVIFVAIFPQIGRGSAKMVNAESTGPTSSKALPRIKETASALFTVYLIFTIAAAAAYMLCGLTFLDAIDTSFSTIATGGFSTKDASIAYYNNPVLELVIAFFMIISSANFGIYVEARKRGLSAITGDMEFRTYIGIVLAATVLMTISLVLQGNYGFVEALRETFFQSASLSSTTGFVSADFDQWPSFAKFIILLIIIVGGCGGSTAGGLKVIRLILLVKSFTSILKLHIHPRAVLHVTVSHERLLPGHHIPRPLLLLHLHGPLHTLGRMHDDGRSRLHGRHRSLLLHHVQRRPGLRPVRSHLYLLGTPRFQQIRRLPLHALRQTRIRHTPCHLHPFLLEKERMVRMR